VLRLLTPASLVLEVTGRSQVPLLVHSLVPPPRLLLVQVGMLELKTGLRRQQVQLRSSGALLMPPRAQSGKSRPKSMGDCLHGCFASGLLEDGAIRGKDTLQLFSH
jgi:hypothetical protein